MHEGYSNLEVLKPVITLNYLEVIRVSIKEIAPNTAVGIVVLLHQPKLREIGITIDLRKTFAMVSLGRVHFRRTIEPGLSRVIPRLVGLAKKCLAPCGSSPGGRGGLSHGAGVIGSGGYQTSWIGSAPFGPP